MRLAKEGYGSITEIQNLDIKTFIDLVQYVEFVNKYQEITYYLNKK